MMKASDSDTNLFPAEVLLPLQSLLDRLPLAVFRKDQHLNYTWGNDNFLADAGLASLDELIGKTDADLPWTAEQTARFRALDLQVMESNTVVANIVERQTIAGGQLIWVDCDGIARSDAGRRSGQW